MKVKTCKSMVPVRILQLTDLHVFKDPEVRLKGIPTRELLEDVVRHIVESGQTFRSRGCDG